MTYRAASRCWSAALIAAAVTAVATPAGDATEGASAQLDPWAFAPIVYLHGSDHLRPASAAAALRVSELWWDHRRCPDDRLESFRGSDVDIERLATGGFAHRAARGIARLCRVARRSFRSNELTRPFNDRSHVPNKEGFYLAFPARDSFRFGATNESSTPDRAYEGAPVYAAVGRDSIAYWFFYAYSSPVKAVEMGRRRDAAHEGDWEHVTVHVVDGKATHVAFYAHGFAPVICDWADVRRDPTTGRPVVYSAWGSHASYNAPGGHGLDVAAEDLRWDTALDLHELPVAVDGSRVEGSTDPEVAWYGFGGGWGRVGKATVAHSFFSYATDTTGPLGPSRFKRGAPTSWEPQGDCV